MLKQVTDIALKAGALMLNFQNAAAHQKEGHYNFVTDADVAVQALIQHELSNLLPAAAFFAEEKQNNPLTDAPTWVVDPIDGTLNFMRRRNHSAISIALLKHKRPVLGVIYNPYTQELFTAEDGKGAFCNGSSIHVSNIAFDRAMVAFGTSPYNSNLAQRTMHAAHQFLLKAGDLRRSGSAALDLCDIACGRADVFFELQLSPWDIAAGSLIVMEAGGVFMTFEQPSLYYEAPTAVLACNPLCKGQALEVLQ